MKLSVVHLDDLEDTGVYMDGKFWQRTNFYEVLEVLAEITQSLDDVWQLELLRADETWFVSEGNEGVWPQKLSEVQLA